MISGDGTLPNLTATGPFWHSQCTATIHKPCGVTAGQPGSDFDEMTRFGALEPIFGESSVCSAE